MTAVEWYDSQLKEIDYKLQSGLINLTQCKVLMDEAKSQAKEIEKEQIINAALYGFRRDSDGDDWQGDNYNAEKYYNTTFKLK